VCAKTKSRIIEFPEPVGFLLLWDNGYHPVTFLFEILTENHCMQNSKLLTHK